MSSKKNKNYRPSTIALMDSRVQESYIEEEVTKIKEEDIEIVLDNEEAISRKLQGKSLRRFVDVGKVLFAMIKDFSTGKYPSIPWLTIATTVVILLYVLNPFDLIPDFIPGIGYLDDLAVFTFGLGLIETDLHRYLDWRIDSTKKELEE